MTMLILLALVVLIAGLCSGAWLVLHKRRRVMTSPTVVRLRALDELFDRAERRMWLAKLSDRSYWDN